MVLWDIKAVNSSQPTTYWTDPAVDMRAVYRYFSTPYSLALPEFAWLTKSGFTTYLNTSDEYRVRVYCAAMFGVKSNWSLPLMCWFLSSSNVSSVKYDCLHLFAQYSQYHTIDPRKMLNQFCLQSVWTTEQIIALYIRYFDNVSNESILWEIA